jgi:uncharacterized cupin superfamily protein
MSDYTIKKIDEGFDPTGDYPGEMHMLGNALDTEQVAFTHRRMPPDTGGKGSYGHSHKTQEEIVFVLSGTPTLKLGDDVIAVEPGHVVRIAPSTVRSIHNDGSEDAVIVIVSVRVDDPREDVAFHDDFWPE